MTKKPLKIMSIVVLVAILCFVVWWWLQPEPAPQYATTPVKKGHIENSVLANGMVQASKLVSVGAQVSGQIKALPVELGQAIKQGDLVAQIDSVTQQNNLKETRASLQSINAQYRAKEVQIHQAQLEYERQQKMLKDDASSHADYESAEANLAVNKAELQQLAAQRQQTEINVNTAEVDLGYTTIKAPMDGTVVYTAVEVGQTVNANQTTPTIIELAQLDTMTIKAQISEADVTKVSPGQVVYFTTLGQPNKKYYGTLKTIEPGPTSMDGEDSDMTSSDSDAVYYNGTFDVANPDHTLRIGMTAQVSIIIEQADNALLIPAQALQKRPDNGEGKAGYQVPVVVNGKLVYRAVEVGINNKVNAQILSGLQAGDAVVIGMPTTGPKMDRPPRRMRF